MSGNANPFWLERWIRLFKYLLTKTYRSISLTLRSLDLRKKKKKKTWTNICSLITEAEPAHDQVQRRTNKRKNHRQGSHRTASAGFLPVS